MTCSVDIHIGVLGLSRYLAGTASFSASQHYIVDEALDATDPIQFCKCMILLGENVIYG